MSLPPDILFVSFLYQNSAFCELVRFCILAEVYDNVELADQSFCESTGIDSLGINI